MNFRGFPLPGNILPRPAPDRYAPAPQIGPDEAQIAADPFEPHQIDITKPSYVPFAAAAAGVLEIAIERAAGRNQNIVRAGIAMNRNRSDRQAIQPGHDPIVDRQKKCAIHGPQRRQCPLIGQQGMPQPDPAPPGRQFAGVVR
jgi:hypothetical protein